MGVGGIYDVASGCAFKEVYSFPNITYPYPPLVSALFCSIPTFCSFCNFFPVLVVYRPLQLLESTAKFSVLI